RDRRQPATGRTGHDAADVIAVRAVSGDRPIDDIRRTAVPIAFSSDAEFRFASGKRPVQLQLEPKGFGLEGFRGTWCVTTGMLSWLTGISRTGPFELSPGSGRLSTAACSSFCIVTSRPRIVFSFQP